MAYHIDNFDDSLVIDGFENGIADSPFSGISDMKNVNIISVPGEASVNFSTASATAPSLQDVAVSSADAGSDVITIASSPTLETYMAVTFSGASLPAGITAGTIYWVSKQSDTTIKIYSDYQMSTLVNITGNGTGTMSTIDMDYPKHFSYARATDDYFLVDKEGRVWSNTYDTGTNSYWTYTGNKINNRSNGNGLVYYEASDETGYLFVFSNSSIDYTPTGASSIAWTYQWSPSAGTAAGYSATPTAVLKTPATKNYTHEAMVAPDNNVYYCDKNWIGRFYEKNPATAFLPSDTSTYVFDQTPLLPGTDRANCLAYLGTNLLVGGFRNIIYPWDTTSSTFNYPIPLSESLVARMVTVNTNTYIFVGNRGRIYITNGSQAQLYKKIPDHLSGVVEPYFGWGGACFGKNQLYFSLYCTNNLNSEISGYGGVWAIDLDTQALRLVHKLSYDTYRGFASAITPVEIATVNSQNPVGTGLLMGWKSQYPIASGDSSGLDTNLSTPYTNSQATIDTDLIPIGTLDNPRNLTRIEYRLVKPLVSGESITIKYRKDFSQSYTTIFTDSTAGHFSDAQPVNFDNAQWIQFQIVLNSTASSPSYVRLKEIRLKGLKGETMADMANISI